MVGVVAAAADEIDHRHHVIGKGCVHAPKVGEIEPSILLAVPPCEKKICAFARLPGIVFGAFDQPLNRIPFTLGWKRRFLLCAKPLERTISIIIRIHNRYFPQKCRSFQPVGVETPAGWKKCIKRAPSLAHALRGLADAYGAEFRSHGEPPRRNLVSRKVAVGSAGEDGAALCGCQQLIGNMLQPYSGAVKGWAINLSEVIWRSLAHLNPRLVGRCRSTRPTGCGASKGFRLLPSWPLRSRQAWRSGSWHTFAC